MLTAIALASVLSLDTGNPDDLEYMAEAIYFESRSEVLACQIVLAQTVINRVNQPRFPNVVKDVIRQNKVKNGKLICQYSYNCDGKPNVMREYDAMVTSYKLASEVLYGNMIDLSNGSDHYYAHKLVTPEWAAKMTDVFVCGDHTFGKLSWE